jgi:hypothetical protein
MNDAADLPVTDSLLDVSDSYGHLRCFHGLLPLVVKTNQYAYLSTSDPADPLGVTWLELALTGMETLRELKLPRVRNAAIVGTGAGLDAVGISHLFVPEQITASDIHPGALHAARWNCAKHARQATRCDVLQSDLFRQYPRESRYDLIFENLPNIPDGTDLLDGIRTASCYGPDSYAADPVSDRNLLTLHYNCLLGARARLRPGGWIVATIGGRVPWEVIREVFARAGFATELLHFGLKTQTEPEVVLPGYARAERNGSPRFLYYYPAEACASILPRQTGNMSIVDTPQAEALNARLQRYGVSAVEALRLHREGKQVCHSVYVVGGTPAPGVGPRT